MSDSCEEETDVSDSELEDFVDRCYEQLTLDSGKVKIEENMYRCPYCPGKKKVAFLHKDLLRHAFDVGRGSYKGDTKHKGRHLALVRFLRNDAADAALSSDFSGLAIIHTCPRELFVYPWVGVLANVDADNCSRIKSDLIKRGLDVNRVRFLSSGGYAAVEFKRGWSGFYSAIRFDAEFLANHCGKNGYLSGSDTPLGDILYGWVAKEDDYNAEGVLGEFLRKNGDLKSVPEVEADEKRKNSLLIDDLIGAISELKSRLVELESSSHDSC